MYEPWHRRSRPAKETAGRYLPSGVPSKRFEGALANGLECPGAYRHRGECIFVWSGQLHGCSCATGGVHTTTQGVTPAARGTDAQVWNDLIRSAALGGVRVPAATALLSNAPLPETWKADGSTVPAAGVPERAARVAVAFWATTTRAKYNYFTALFWLYAGRELVLIVGSKDMTHICCSSGSRPCATSAPRDGFLRATCNFSLTSASPTPGGFPVGLRLRFLRVNLFRLRGGLTARAAAAGAGFHANQSSSNRALRPRLQQRTAGCIFQELVIAWLLPSDAVFEPDVYCLEYRQGLGHNRRLRSYIGRCAEQGSTFQYFSYGASCRLDAANGGADEEQHKREAEWLRRPHRVLEVSYYVRRVTQAANTESHCLRALTMSRPSRKVTSNGSEQPLRGALDSVGPQRSCAADDAGVALSAATTKGEKELLHDSAQHFPKKLVPLLEAGEVRYARDAAAAAARVKNGAVADCSTLCNEVVARAAQEDNDCPFMMLFGDADPPVPAAVRGAAFAITLCGAPGGTPALGAPSTEFRGTGVLKKRVPGAHERRLLRLNVPANAYSTPRSHLRHSVREGGTAAANGVACAESCTKTFTVACVATEGGEQEGGREDIVAHPARTADATGEWIAAAHGQAEVEWEPFNPGYWQWKAKCAAAATIVMCTTSAEISVGSVLVDLALALFTPTSAVAPAALAILVANTSAVTGRISDATAAAAASASAAQVAGASCMECDSSNCCSRIQGLCGTSLRRVALILQCMTACLWSISASSHCSEISKRCITRQRRRFSLAQELVWWCVYCCTFTGENSLLRATAIDPFEEGVPVPGPPLRRIPSDFVAISVDPEQTEPAKPQQIQGGPAPFVPEGAAAPTADAGPTLDRLRTFWGKTHSARRASRSRRVGGSHAPWMGGVLFCERLASSKRSQFARNGTGYSANYQSFLNTFDGDAQVRLPFRPEGPSAPNASAVQHLLCAVMSPRRVEPEGGNKERENEQSGNRANSNQNERHALDRSRGAPRRLPSETHGTRSAARSRFLKGTFQTAYEGLSNARERCDVWTCNKVVELSELIHNRNAAAVGVTIETEAASRDCVAAEVTVQEDSATRRIAATDVRPFQTGDFKKGVRTSELEEQPRRGAISSDLPQLLPHAAASAAPAAVARTAARMNASANAAGSVRTVGGLEAAKTPLSTPENFTSAYQTSPYIGSNGRIPASRGCAPCRLTFFHHRFSAPCWALQSGRRSYQRAESELLSSTCCDASVAQAASPSRPTGGASADFGSTVEPLGQRKGETEADDSQGQSGTPVPPSTLLRYLLHAALQILRDSDTLWSCTDTPRPTDASGVFESDRTEADFADVPAGGLPHARAPLLSLHTSSSAAYAHHSDDAEAQTFACVSRRRGATRSSGAKWSAAALAVVPCNEAPSGGNGVDRQGRASSPQQRPIKHSIESYCQCRSFVYLASSLLSLLCIVVFLSHAFNVGFIRWLQRRWTREAPRPVHGRCIFNAATGRDSPAGTAPPLDRRSVPYSLTEKPITSCKRPSRFLFDLTEILWLIHIVVLVKTRLAECTIPQKHRDMHPDLISPVTPRTDSGSVPFSRAASRAHSTEGLRSASMTCEARAILCVCDTVSEVRLVLLFYSEIRTALSRYAIKVCDGDRVVGVSVALHHSLMRAVENGQDAALAFILPSDSFILPFDSGRLLAALACTLQGPFLSQPYLLSLAACSAVIHQPSGRGEIGKVTYFYIFQFHLGNQRSRWAIVTANALRGITAAACPGQRIGLPTGAASVRGSRWRAHRPGHAAPAVKNAVNFREVGRAPAAAPLVAVRQLMRLARDSGGAKIPCPAMTLCAFFGLCVHTSGAAVFHAHYAAAHVLGGTEINVSPDYCSDFWQLLFVCCRRAFRAAAACCGGSVVRAIDNLSHVAERALHAFLPSPHATDAGALALLPSVERHSKRGARAATSYSASASTSSAAAALHAGGVATAVQRTTGDVSTACLCDVFDDSQAYEVPFSVTCDASLLLSTCVCMLSSRAALSSGSVRNLFLDLLFSRPLTRLSARNHFLNVINSSPHMRIQEQVSSQATRRKESFLDVVFRHCCSNSPVAGPLAVTGKAVSKAGVGRVATRSIPGFVFRTWIMRARVASCRRGSDVSEHAYLVAPSRCSRPKPSPPDDAAFEGTRPSDATKMKSSPRPPGQNRSTGRAATATTACAAGMSTSDHWSGTPNGFVKVEDGNEGTGGRAFARSRVPAACTGAAAALGFAAASPTVAHLVCTGLLGSVWLLTVGLMCIATVLAAALAVSAIVVSFAAAGGARGAGLLIGTRRLRAALFGAAPSLSTAASHKTKQLSRCSRSASRNQMIPRIPWSLPSSPASLSRWDLKTAPATDMLWPRSLHRHKASVRLLLLVAYCTCWCRSFTGGTAFDGGLENPEASSDRLPLPTGASSSSLSDALKHMSLQPVSSLSYSVGAASRANVFASPRSGSVAALPPSSSPYAGTYGSGFDSSSPHPPVTSAIFTLAEHLSAEPSEASQTFFGAPEASGDLRPGGTGDFFMLHRRRLTLPPSSVPVPRPHPSGFTEAASPDAARPSRGTLSVQGGNPACMNVRASPRPGAAARRQLSAGQGSTLDRVAAGLAQRQDTASTGTGETGATNVTGGGTGDVPSAATQKDENAAGRKEESREGRLPTKAEPSDATSAAVTDGEKAARNGVPNSSGTTAAGVDDRTQSEAATRGKDSLNVSTKPVKQQQGSGSSPTNQVWGSRPGAVQHVLENAEAGPAAPTTVAAAAAVPGDQQLEASSRDSAGARQSPRGNELEAGGAALAPPASTGSVTASPVNAEAGTSSATVGHPGGASGQVPVSVDAPEPSQQSSATPEGSRTPGKAAQPPSVLTQLFAASRTLPTATFVPTIGTATLSTTERSTGAPLSSVASTAASPAAPTTTASSAAVPPSPAAHTQPAGDVLAGATEVPAASVPQQVQTTGEKPAGSAAAGKEEPHVYIRTPQAAVVVPAVLQQEVDADQQLVRVTIPLLPSMRLSTHSQVSENGSNGKGASGALLGDGSRQRGTPSIVSLGKEGGSTTSKREQLGEARKQEQERDSAKGENPESSKRRAHRDSSSAANGGAHSSPGGAGETLEEMSSNEKEIVISTGLLTLLVVLAVSLVLAHVSRKCRLDWLQMPVCATVLGLVVGAALKFGLQVKGPLLDTILAMNEDVFFVMLLPPIIFEGGLGLSEGSFSVPFMRNFGAIMWLACFCTIISFCWVGCLMFFGGQLRLSLPLTVRQAFAFGALISSTDPVSVLALFKDLHAKRLIHVLKHCMKAPMVTMVLSIVSSNWVFGESLLNDAISIVLYRTVASEENTSVGAAILAFFLTFFVSLLVGLAVGLFCALTYKYMDLHKEENQILESALLLLIPWIAYLVADGAGYSGIVAICFCGVAVGKYAFPNLSAAAQATSRSVFTCFSLLAETVVFVFLGLAVFSFDQELYTFPFGLYALGFVATFTARGVSIYVTCLIINFFRSSSKITGQQQLALALCGLRGAIAFALSERASHDFGGREGAALLSLTLWLALFTILVLGPSLVVILDHLGVFESRGCSSRNAAAKARRKQHLKNCCSDCHVEELRPQRLNTGESTAADEISLCNPDGSTAGGDSNTGDSSSRGEEGDEDDEDSLEALTRGTCGSLKRMLLHIDERYMIPMFTHSDNRHRQQLPAPQLLQQHSEDGGMLLPEAVPGRLRAVGSRRRNRFSPAAVGRLARFTRDVQVRDSSLPVVASFAAGARPHSAAFTGDGRRTTSQQSDSSGRFSSRSAVSAPPGRPTQQPTNFKGSGTLSNKSSNSVFSNSSSSSTDMERGSAVLLLPGHARSTSTSGNGRARSRRRVASFGRTASSRRPVLVQSRFVPAPVVTTTNEEQASRAGWPPQQSSEFGSCEMPVHSAASSNFSAARQQDGLRSGVLSWTSYQLRRISLGIFAGAAAARTESYSATRRRPTATATSHISSKERDAPAAEQLPVTGSLFRRGGTGIRPSSRDLQLLLSGASTTSSSGGTHTKELSSSGRTRRRTCCSYTASLRKYRQSQYQPLREQLDQSQQPVEGSRTCVEPHVLGMPQYAAELKQPPSPDEDGGTHSHGIQSRGGIRETTAATRAPAATPVPAGSGPAAEIFQCTAGAAVSDLLEKGRKRGRPETRASKLSAGEDCRGHETYEEKEVEVEEAEGDIDRATARPAVAGVKTPEKQTTSSDDWSSLSRSEELEGDHCKTIHQALVAEPQSLSPHGTPLVLQQQPQQQPQQQQWDPTAEQLVV